jgi:tetratricopeptide (TPR) repeat protein
MRAQGIESRKNVMDKYCNSEEWIASYLDRTIPETERREFEEHLARCDRCLVELITAQTELKEISSEMEKEIAARRTMRNKHPWRFIYPSGRLIPLARFGRSIPTSPALSSLTAIAAAIIFIIALQSYRFDPDYREGIYLLGRLMEVRETGKLKLAGETTKPLTANNTYRGNGLLHLNLALITDERLESALARHPENARIFSALGHLHMVDGQPEMAGIYYERALRVRPNDPVSLNNLAAVAYRRGKIEEAEELLLEAKRHENPPPECFYNLGVLYGETGERELQRVNLEIYLEMVPDSPWADEARGMLEADQQKQLGR